MSKLKKKRQLDLPDRQLARAFGFSAIDLAANRSGYMSLPQHMAFPPAWQPLLRWIIDWLPQRNMPKVDVIRARAQLQYAQYQTFAFQRADLHEVFTVNFGMESFRLTSKTVPDAQFRCVVRCVRHQGYAHDPQPGARRTGCDLMPLYPNRI